MPNKNEQFQHLLLFKFSQGSKATKTVTEFCDVYEEGAITERTSQKWFSRFKNENFNLTNSPRSGRPDQVNEDWLNELIPEDTC